MTEKSVLGPITTDDTSPLDTILYSNTQLDLSIRTEKPVGSPKYSRIALLKAAAEGDADALKDILDAGVRVDLTSGDHDDDDDYYTGKTAPEGKDKSYALYEAAHNRKGSTPLIVAAYRGQADMVQVSLEHGADAHATSTGHQGGKTPLHLILGHPLQYYKKRDPSDYPATVRLLLAAGSDVSAKDDRGRTAVDLLQMSEREYRNQIFKVLEEFNRK